MSDWVGGDRDLSAQDLDRHFTPTSIDRRVDGRVVEQVSWNSWGAFYKRWDDAGELIESRRATTADYERSKQWLQERTTST